LAIVSACAPAATAVAATQTAKVQASVVKPLTLTADQGLDLGSITLRTGAWSNAIVSLSRAGVFTCSNPNVTCAGATRVAQYTVVGTNNQTVRISAPSVTMINQTDPTKTLVLMPDAPATVVLPNSGNKGSTFTVGGSLTLNSTTADGLYSGTFNVTVDY
jgi:hypothetical protein